MNTLTLKVYVTESHIERGAERDCSCCPIALAIREAVVGTPLAVFREQITVGEEMAESGYTLNVGELCRVALPTEVLDFIHRFDGSGPYRLTTNPSEVHPSRRGRWYLLLLPFNFTLELKLP